MVTGLKHICCILLPAFLIGCSDDSYRGRIDEVLAGNDKMPVILSLGDPSGNITSGKSSTKGTGAVDAASDLLDDGKYVYVYGFGSSASSFALRSESDPYSCLIDASLDTPGAVSGRKASVSATDTYLNWVDSDRTVYWPTGERGAEPYDFFAYYLDDIPVRDSDYDRTDEGISIKVNIDGNNDLMAGRASLTEKQLQRFSADERARVQEYAYSYYTAIRDVTPTIVLNHQLVRLDFEIIPGVTLGINKEMSIMDVSVESRTSGLFTVAAKDESLVGLDFSGDVKKLYLMEKDGSPFVPVTFLTRSSESVPADKITLGNSLFLAPSDSYPFRLTIREKYDGEENSSENFSPIILTTDGGFRAGTRYKVKITVIGLTNIAVSVSIVPWLDGGGMTVDKGDEPPGSIIENF